MRSTDQNQQLQQLAEDLTVAGVVGPFAASKWDKGLYIAYHMSTPYLGVPTGSDVEAIVAQLEAAGAKSFLVDSQWDLLTAFHQQSDWTLKDVFKSGSLEIHVFEPQAQVQCAGY